MIGLPEFRSRVIPVVSIESADEAKPLAEALLAGGIDVIEITLRRPGGLPGIAALARSDLPICVGAGTLLNARDVAEAVDAGARFGLSPGCTPTLLDSVGKMGLPFVPGVMTPSEIMTVQAANYSLMKFFPAVQAGGIAMLRAIAGPLPNVRFIPTGGVRPESLADWLREPNVAWVGGTWIAPASLIASRDWQAITRMARQATAIGNPNSGGRI